MNKKSFLPDSLISRDACLIALLLFFPVGLVHEGGHMAVCFANGFSPTLNYSTMRGECDHIPHPVRLYWAIGGGLGVIVSLTPLSIKKIRNSIKFKIGLITLAIGQAVVGGVETLAHSWYLDNPSSNLLIIIIDFILLSVLLFCFARTTTKSSYKQS